MEKRNHGPLIISSLTIALGVASFALCIASEFRKAKRKDLKLDDKLCFLPRSDAFGSGLSALVCLCVAHLVANLIVCKGFCSGEREKRRNCYENKSLVSILLCSLSWISFITAVVLISASTSMNTGQAYGKGWLDGDCYIVKDGIFVGGGVLVLVSVGSTIASTFLPKSGSQIGFKAVGTKCKVDSPKATNEQNHS